MAMLGAMDTRFTLDANVPDDLGLILFDSSTDQQFCEYEMRPILDFLVNPSEILTTDSQSQQLCTANHHHHDHQGRPSRQSSTRGMVVENSEKTNRRCQCHQYPHITDKTQRFIRKGDNSIKRQEQ